MVKALLRWAGSKRKLLPELTKYYSVDFDNYLEPFVGSGQLFFNLPIKNAILSDVNQDLINMYNAVKINPLQVHQLLSSFQRGKEQYYHIRDSKVISTCENYKAARFIYLNTFCFNGLYRTNMAGKFNVPYSESSGTMIELEELLEISNILQKARFVNGDFEEVVLAHCKSNDFVYLDPPYAIKNKRIFNQYNPTTFGLNDLDRLKNLVNHINDIGSKFVLSYADCDEAAFLSKDWNFKKVSTVRNISGFAKHRKKETEVLITNLCL